MNLLEIPAILDGYSGFLPGFVATLVVGLALARPVGRSLGVRPVLGFALVVGVGLALSATVTPSHEALAHGIRGSGTCDLGRIGRPSLAELAWPGEALLNILLFVPLGAAIGLCPPSRAKLGVVALAYAMPLAIEAIQLVATPLGRECQSADVVDNLTGLTLAITAATLVRWTVAVLASWLHRGREVGQLRQDGPDGPREDPEVQPR